MESIIFIIIVPWYSIDHYWFPMMILYIIYLVICLTRGRVDMIGGYMMNRTCSIQFITPP